MNAKTVEMQLQSLSASYMNNECQLNDDLKQQEAEKNMDFYLALMTLNVLGSIQLTDQSVTPASLQMEIENRP